MSRLANHMPSLLALLSRLSADESARICGELARGESQMRADAFGQAAEVVEAWKPQNQTTKNAAMELRMRELAERKAGDA